MFVFGGAGVAVPIDFDQTPSVGGDGLFDGRVIVAVSAPDELQPGDGLFDFGPDDQVGVGVTFHQFESGVDLVWGDFGDHADTSDRATVAFDGGGR